MVQESAKEWSPRLHVAVKVNAGNDPNGNPRRGWIILEARTGDMIDFVEEGYYGRAALTKAYPEASEGPVVLTTPGQFRDLRRFAREQEERHGRGEI